MLTKETFGAMSGVGVGGSDESGAVATVSGDVKESVCDRAELDTAQYPVNQWIVVGEPVVSQHCDTACFQWSYIEHDGLLVA